MNFEIKKNVSAKIYLNQIKGCLLLNGREIKKNSLKIQMFNNLLNSLSISVNIIAERNRKNFIITNKLLLEISKKIKEISNKRNKLKEEIKKNELKIKKENELVIYQSSQKKSNLLLFFTPKLIVFITIFIVFLIDYKPTLSKINEKNILEIKELEKDFKINKCKENGYLPSLKPHCESMINKIEILKNKKIPKISVFSIWLGDMYDRLIDTFGYINTIIILVLYIITIIIFIKI